MKQTVTGRQATSDKIKPRNWCASCVNKATGTYKQYVTINVFSWRQWLRARTSVLRNTHYFYTCNLDRQLYQDSITSCSRYQLIHFSPHIYMFGRIGLILLTFLNVRNNHLMKMIEILANTPLPVVRVSVVSNSGDTITYIGDSDKNLRNPKRK